MKSKRAITEAEGIDIVELARESHLLSLRESHDPEMFPQLNNISPKFFFRFLPVPSDPGPTPEYAFVRDADQITFPDSESRARYEVFISTWNNTWESGSLRPHFLKRHVPEQLRWVLKYGGNLRLVRRHPKHSYDAYAPMYHLLPKATLERFELPPLRRGLWPHFGSNHLLEYVLPRDFGSRLQQAVAFHLWPHLGARGKMIAFSKSEPIRLLAHNLNFWMPYLDLVAQRRAREFGRTELESAEIADYDKVKDGLPDGMSLESPLRGGTLWMGEAEAHEATLDLIETADNNGDLRAILDAIRSHRVTDDFSDRWSFEREDFERKLYSKRSKVKVSFVEMDDTIPVHGPNSEVDKTLFWEDFFAMLDQKERRIVVCLRKGTTSMAEIAKELGYASHSPISKALARIRRKAQRLLS